MSKFWQKKYISKYTGAEIDAAVGNVPTVTEADAGKVLVVDETGKIVAGEGGGGVSVIDFPEFPNAVAIAVLGLVGSATTTYTSASFDVTEKYADYVEAFGNLKNGDVFTLTYPGTTFPNSIGLVARIENNPKSILINTTIIMGDNSAIYRTDMELFIASTEEATLTVGAIKSSVAT